MVDLRHFRGAARDERALRRRACQPATTSVTKPGIRGASSPMLS